MRKTSECNSSTLRSRKETEDVGDGGWGVGFQELLEKVVEREITGTFEEYFIPTKRPRGLVAACDERHKLACNYHEDG